MKTILLYFHLYPRKVEYTFFFVSHFKLSYFSNKNYLTNILVSQLLIKGGHNTFLSPFVPSDIGSKLFDFRIRLFLEV